MAILVPIILFVGLVVVATYLGGMAIGNMQRR